MCNYTALKLPKQAVSNNSGAVTVFVAVIYILLVTAVSVAIDGGRLYLIRAKAQHACDAMALGMAKIAQTNPGFYNNYGNDLQALVQANYPGSYNGPRYMGSYVGWDAFGGWGNSYDADLEIEVPPLLMQIFGVGNTSVFLQCEVTRVPLPSPIYVVDKGNNRIEKFDSGGNYLGQFGSAGSGDGQLKWPTDITIDGSGNIWVTDSYNWRVEKFDSNGNYLSQFFPPVTILNRLAFDGSGNLWITSLGDNRVSKLDSNGNLLLQFGGWGSGNGQFKGPDGIAIDGSNNVYIADSANNRIQKFDSNGNYLSQFGSAGSGNGQLSGPTGIAIDGGGNIWVVEWGNHRVEEFDSNGNYLSQFPISGFWPYGLALDGGGNLWITDQVNNTVTEYDRSGNRLAQFGSTGSGNGQFNDAVGIAISNAPVSWRFVLNP